MIHIAPFHPDHLIEVDTVPVFGMTEEARRDPAWRRQFFYTALSQTAVGGGRIVGCYGIVPYLWAGRGFVWAAFDKDIGSGLFAAVVLRIRREMNMVMEHGFYRLETAVDPDFKPGRRLAAALGFEIEGMAKKMDGARDYLIYARTS